MKRRKRLQKFLSIFLIALLAFPTGILPVLAEGSEELENEGKVVYHETFEDGIVGFNQSGEVQLVHVENKYFEGNKNGKALYLKDRGEEDYDAADLSFSTAGLKEGYTYHVTVNGFVDEDVDVPEGAEAVLLTLDNYSWLSNVPMVAGEAFTLSGEYTVDVDRAHTLRFQSNKDGIGVPFYIGEILIKEVSGPVVEEPEPFEPKTILHHDFEEDSTEGWFNLDWEGHPPADIIVTDEAASSGNKSLGYFNRPDNSRLTYNLGEKLTPGGIYNISFDVKLKEGTTNVVFASKYVYLGTDKYPWLINPVEVGSDDWVTFELTNFEYHLDATELLVWIQTQTSSEEPSSNDFYLDNFKVVQVGMMKEPEDPIEIPDGEEIAYFTDFEDGTTQGWEARSGNETLTVTDEDAKNGEYSLLVENRLASSDAAILDVVENIYPGYDYKVSLWVKLAPGEPNTPLQLSAAEKVEGAETSYWPPVISPTMVTDEEWVYLEGIYSVPRTIEALSLYVEEEYDEDSTSGVSYYIDDFKMEVYVSDHPVQTDLTPLKDIYKDHFLIGNAVESVHFNGRTLELLTHHHNLVTAENIMKPENYYQNGEFNSAGPDRFLQNAIENDLLIHGHVLLWHSQSEDSLYQNPDGSYKSRDEALANMHEHIENVMRSAYEVAGESIISWDVVNEALDPSDGDWSNPEDWKSKLRKASGWLHSVGDDYIYQAFLKARQVADDLGQEDMVLYYNDYNDHVQEKARTMYYMIKDINEQYAEEFPEDDRPLISGVGMQAHYRTSVNIENIRESLERFIDLGIEVGVTELDVGASAGTTLTEKEELEQAYFYAQLFALYKEHSEHISRVTFWGLSDANSWRSESNPLLFDRDLQAKRAYYAVADPEKYLAENEDPGLVVARQGKAVYGTPIIDGEIDEIWAEAPVLPINQFQTAHNGATGEARVLWDQENIYVLVEVNDTELDKSASQPHEQDSVEVFIDEQNTKAASYGEGHGQYRVNYDNETSFNPADIGEGFESRTVVNGTNYLVEMKIPFKTTTLEAGQKIGFDVQINDAANGTRRSIAIWSDVNTGMGWSDPSVFGELTLVEALDEEPSMEIEIKPNEPTAIQPGQRINVISEDGQVAKITIPESVPANTVIEVKFIDPAELEDAKSDGNTFLTPAGQIVEVNLDLPDGFEADEDDLFTLTLAYDTNEKWVAIYRLNEETGLWDRMDGIVDPEAGTVTVKVPYFSTYGVFTIPLEDVISDLEDRIDELEGENEELREIIAELQDDIEKLEKGQMDIDELLDRIAALEAKVAELESIVDGKDPVDEDDVDKDEKDQEKVNGKDESDKDQEKVTGKEMPNTATNIYNWLLVGGFIVLVSAAYLLVSRRKRA